jgi:histidine ammonia-lyase
MNLPHSSSLHSPVIVLDGQTLNLKNLEAIARHGAQVELCPSALLKVQEARNVVENRLKNGGTFYGINTGFGALSDVLIPPHQLTQLQLNLIRSHACGVGDPLPTDVVRAVLALRIQTMLRGNSGVSVGVVQRMTQFLNKGLIPKVPSQGSVGASGDLAPLAHIALALVGEGEILDLYSSNQYLPASKVLASHGIIPLVPSAKEGLCLINGTQVMTAIGMLSCIDVGHLCNSADIAAAMTIDATNGTSTSMRTEIHESRPHAGQVQSAKIIQWALQDDAIRLSHENCSRVQDPYSLRCSPQVHGAVRDTLSYVTKVFETEANSSTDNPLVFAQTDEILSGGNFHGQPIAFALDFLAIATCELGSISERRIEKLVNPHMSSLPPFLAKDSGLHSGFMIPHVVAAALVSENKIYAHPASIDSIPTSAEKEDHVSMGMTSALKLQKILTNVSKVLAIELMAAAQGLEFRKPLEGGLGVRAAYSQIREISPPMFEDRSLTAEIEHISKLVIRDWLKVSEFG